MAANAAGIYGAQLFRSDDRPRYHRALSIDVAIIAIALAAAVFLAFYYWRRKQNGKLNEDNKHIIENDNHEVDSEVKISPPQTPPLQRLE